MKTPHTYAIIFAVILVCWILTFLIPAGKFSTHTIEMFCRILDCQVGDIMEYIRDEEG